MHVDITSITHRILIASFLPGVGKSTLWQVVSQHDFAKTTGEDSLPDFFPELSNSRERARMLDVARRKAERQIELAKAGNIRIIGFWDRDYPQAFRRASASPAVFWFRGDASILNIPSVGIIGTRQPTPSGEESARRISRAMARAGLCVVSGLALGIDTIAHAAALEVDGITLAVLAGGLNGISPKSNVELANEILLKDGGLMSEFPLSSPTFSSNFVTRDATQAAMSMGIILVQSDRMGGSMHASRAIVKLGRHLIVVAPVAQDVVNNEEKIEANRLFVNQGFSNLVANLKFPDNVESATHILRGRDQYDAIIDVVRKEWAGIQPKKR